MNAGLLTAMLCREEIQLNKPPTHLYADLPAERKNNFDTEGRKDSVFLLPYFTFSPVQEKQIPR